jgi:hypothetical protein
MEKRVGSPRYANRPHQGNRAANSDQNRGINPFPLQRVALASSDEHKGSRVTAFFHGKQPGTAALALMQASGKVWQFT